MKAITRRSFISSMITGALAISCLGITGCGSEPTESAADNLVEQEATVETPTPAAIDDINFKSLGTFTYQNNDPNSPLQKFQVVHSKLGGEDTWGIRIYPAENPGIFQRIFEWNPSYESPEYTLFTWCDEAGSVDGRSMSFESQIKNNIDVMGEDVVALFRLWGHGSNNGSDMKVNNAQYILNKLPDDSGLERWNSFASDEDLYFTCIEFVSSEDTYAEPEKSAEELQQEEDGRETLREFNERMTREMTGQ